MAEKVLQEVTIVCYFILTNFSTYILQGAGGILRQADSVYLNSEQVSHSQQ